MDVIKFGIIFFPVLSFVEMFSYGWNNVTSLNVFMSSLRTENPGDQDVSPV